jgi:hypothetical protein
MKGVLPWLVCWARCAGTRDFCPAMAALVGVVQNIFFYQGALFTSFVPIAQQAGQGVVPRRLSLNMCLWSHPLDCLGRGGGGSRGVGGVGGGGRTKALSQV